MKQAQKMEIITLVEQSELSVKATLKELGIHRSTFYEWYKRYLEKGYDGLADAPVQRRGYWNQLPEREKERVVALALDRPDLSCRELAWHITDQEGWFISDLRPRPDLGSNHPFIESSKVEAWSLLRLTS